MEQLAAVPSRPAESWTAIPGLSRLAGPGVHNFSRGGFGFSRVRETGIFLDRLQPVVLETWWRRHFFYLRRSVQPCVPPHFLRAGTTYKPRSGRAENPEYPLFLVK